LRRILPQARLVATVTEKGAIDDVCAKRTDAAFVDELTGIAALLAGPSCASQPLRVIPLPALRVTLGVGATLENREVADVIRRGMDAVSGEGNLARTLTSWGFFSPHSMEYIRALRNARQREQWLTATIAIFAALLALTGFSANRIRRQRNQIELAEGALRRSEQKLRLMADNLREMVLAYDMNRKLIFANSSVETLTGYAVADLEKAGWINWFHTDDQLRMTGHWESIFQGGSIQDEEYRLLMKDGQVKWVAATWGPILDGTGRQIGVQGSEHDVTKRKLAEEALQEAQERSLQAQKLESIGRLAGGVAHDFNNLLTVINGYSDLAFQKLGEGSPLRPEIDQIRKAGARAADLTQQLLAFGRKQMIQPRPVDLNKIVAESEKMLRRLLGEDIELRTRLSPSLRRVMADPGQIHQVLMNLLLNARDAMRDGGELILETANVEIDSSYVEDHPEVTTGAFVLLTVTDSGSGMDEEISKHIFEPFFTTKGPSQGSGLGLATVYGIVKQSQGWIGVSTKPGKGTAFKIYLPQISADIEAHSDAEGDRDDLEGCETVLVVEDQDEVRGVATTVLKSHGYHVLEAADGAKALALVEAHPASIDLLLTDVVLPGMNGKELAECLRKLLPAVKVLYTSGYSGDLIGHRGVLYREMAYIAKPFTPDGLAIKVREVLASS
jgi:PAS domain S-box-containing protein